MPAPKHENRVHPHVSVKVRVDTARILRVLAAVDGHTMLDIIADAVERVHGDRVRRIEEARRSGPAHAMTESAGARPEPTR